MGETVIIPAQCIFATSNDSFDDLSRMPDSNRCTSVLHLYYLDLNEAKLGTAIIGFMYGLYRHQ